MGGMLLASQWMRKDPESMQTVPLTGKDQDEQSDHSKSISLNFNQARKTRSFWYLCMAKFADFFCLMSVINHIVPHGIDLGMSPTLAVTVLSTIGGCSILGRLLLGSLFDRIGPQKSLWLCFSLLLMGLTMIFFTTDPWMLFLFAPVYGISHGGFFVVATPSIAHFFGT